MAMARLHVQRRERTAGAVLRPKGSSRNEASSGCRSRKPAYTSRVWKYRSRLVTVTSLVTPGSANARAAVFASSVWPSGNGMNAFGAISRDSGHSRVPAPPQDHGTMGAAMAMRAGQGGARRNGASLPTRPCDAATGVCASRVVSAHRSASHRRDRVAPRRSTGANWFDGDCNELGHAEALFLETLSMQLVLRNDETYALAANSRTSHGSARW